MMNESVDHLRSGDCLIKLMIFQGNQLTKSLPLRSAESLTIGRCSKCDIVVSDPSCDAAHAKLSTRDGGWFIEDLNSLNGTSVQGKPIFGVHRLEIGDRVSMGSETQLVFTSNEILARLTNCDESACLKSIFTWVPEMRMPGVEPGPTLDEREFPSSCLRKASLVNLPIEQLYVLAIQLHKQAALTEPDETSEILLAETAVRELATLSRATSIGICRVDGKRPGKILYHSGATIDRPDLTTPVSDMVRTTLTVWRRIGTTSDQSPTSVICAPVEWDIQTSNHHPPRWNRRVVGALYLLGPSHCLSTRDVDIASLMGKSFATCWHTLADRNAEYAQSKQANARLSEVVWAGSDFVGENERIAKLKQKVLQIAPARATVLILGEPGVGKEVLARQIHNLSDRHGQPFIPVNCAAIPHELVESQLFGHRQDAFTGANRDRIGFFEAAERGTLFLDEIGEMPVSIQPKLLRALQGGHFTPVGATREVHADVRVVAATNADLRNRVREGSFREDLYYRLAVVELTVPPLRERIDDIPLIGTRLLQDLANQQGRNVRGFTRPAMALLQKHTWDGNVRELRNFVERVLLFVPHNQVEVDAKLTRDNLSISTDYSGTSLYPLELIGFERFKATQELSYAVAQLGVSKTRTAAAQSMGLSREGLSKMIKRHLDDHPSLLAKPRFARISLEYLADKLKSRGKLEWVADDLKWDLDTLRKTICRQSSQCPELATEPKVAQLKQACD